MKWSSDSQVISSLPSCIVAFLPNGIVVEAEQWKKSCLLQPAELCEAFDIVKEASTASSDDVIVRVSQQPERERVAVCEARGNFTATCTQAAIPSR